MRNIACLGLALLCAPLLVSTPGQAVATCTSGENVSCYHLNLNNAIAGIIGAGDIEVTLTAPREVAETDSALTISVGLTGPTTTTPVFTAVGNSVTGCTLGTGVQTTAATTQSFMGWETFPATMTDTQCEGYIEVKLVGGAVPATIVDFLLTFNVKAADAPHQDFTYLCDHTGAASTSYNPTSTTCGTPNVNNALSGTVNIAQSGTWTVTNAGSQAITLSGTTHQVIDSWPTLVSTVTNSGTLNIQNTAGQTFALSGTVNTPLSGTITANGAQTLSGTVNTPTTGTLTVTNAGGQSIAVTSWPQLAAVLSGTMTNLECSTAALAADPKACTINSTTMVSGPINETINIPGSVTVHMCDPAQPGNPCPTPSSISNSFLGKDGLLEIILMAVFGAYLWAASQQVPVRVLGAVIEFYAGFHALTVATLYGHTTLALILFITGAVFILWMSIQELAKRATLRADAQAQAEAVGDA